MERGPDLGCDWKYWGTPCRVVNVIIEDGHVVALLINTGVGPDIRAELNELTYEVRRDS